jgi:NADH-ubiquinone oxidoreductase chain 6
MISGFLGYYFITKTWKDKEIINIKDHILKVSSDNWDNNIIDVSHINSIGSILYTSFIVWLIIISIILLLAMVGAIVITINRSFA